MCLCKAVLAECGQGCILEYRAWWQFNNKTKNRKISNKNKPTGKVKDAIFY